MHWVCDSGRQLLIAQWVCTVCFNLYYICMRGSKLLKEQLESHVRFYIPVTLVNMHLCMCKCVVKVKAGQFVYVLYECSSTPVRCVHGWHILPAKIATFLLLTIERARNSVHVQFVCCDVRDAGSK